MTSRLRRFAERWRAPGTLSFHVRTLLAFVLIAAPLALAPRPASAAGAGETIEVTDLAGRTVTVKRGIQRMILDKADHTHGMRDEPQRYWNAVLEFFNQSSPTRS